METTERQRNITPKLDKINMGDGTPDDGITDTTSKWSRVPSNLGDI